MHTRSRTSNRAAAAAAAALLALVAAAPTASAVNATVVDGVLIASPGGGAPRTVGPLVSSLNAAIAATFPALPNLSPSSRVLLVNSSLLHFLTLIGIYSVDVPLMLPPRLVLVLRGTTLRAAPNFTGSALLLANGSRFAAVVAPGGPSDALVTCLNAAGGRTLPSPTGVLASSADGFLLDGVTVEGCGHDGGTALVTLRGAPYTNGGEVVNCELRHGARATWSLAIARPVVRRNVVFNCSVHTLDCDAFTNGAAFLDNAVANCTQEGVFLEQGSTNAVVARNALGPGLASGVSVYNYNFGVPASGFVVAGNSVTRSKRGVGVGSTARTEGALAEDVWVVGNTLSANPGGGIFVNGRAGGITVAGNTDTDGLWPLSTAATASGNLTAFDPMARVRVYSAPVGGGGASGAAAPGTWNATVVGGVLSSPGVPNATVGGLVSGLNAAVRRLFGAAPWAPAQEPIPINATSLCYLTLTGAFLVDEPLELRAWTVLVLRGATLRAAPNFTGSALLLANGSRFAAVVAPGGPSDALVTCLNAAGGRTLPSPTGVLASSADGFLLDGITVEGCGADGGGGALVALTGTGSVAGGADADTAGGEVSNCALRAGGGVGVLVSGVHRPLVRSNNVSGCAGHGVDVGAGIYRALVTANSAWGNGGAGVHLARGARITTVTLNTLGPANGVGLALYAPPGGGVGGLTQPQPQQLLASLGTHAVVGNKLAGNVGAGVWVAAAASATITSAGGYAYDSLFTGNELGGGGGGGEGHAVADVVVDGGAWGRQLLAPAGCSFALVAGSDGGGVLLVDPHDRARMALLPSPTPTGSGTRTGTASRSGSITVSASRSAAPLGSATGSVSGTSTSTASGSSSRSVGPSATLSATSTAAFTATSSASAAASASAADTGGSTANPAPTASASASVAFSAASTAATSSASAAASASAADTGGSTANPAPTASASASVAFSAASTAATSSASAAASASAADTGGSTASPAPTASASVSATLSAASTAATSSASAAASVTGTNTGAPTTASSGTAAPTPSPSGTASKSRNPVTPSRAATRTRTSFRTRTASCSRSRSGSRSKTRSRSQKKKR